MIMQTCLLYKGVSYMREPTVVCVPKTWSLPAHTKSMSFENTDYTHDTYTISATRTYCLHSMEIIYFF